MEVILRDDVPGLGDISDKVNVKPGYARNFLIPRGLAFEAGSSSAKQVSHLMKQVDAKKKKMKLEAEERAKKVSGISVFTTLKTASGGKVFGSVGQKDIADLLSRQGLVVDRRRVLIDEPIKKLGSHEIPVRLHAEVVATVTLNIAGQEASRDEVERQVKKFSEKLSNIESEADSE